MTSLSDIVHVDRSDFVVMSDRAFVVISDWAYVVISDWAFNKIRNISIKICLEEENSDRSIYGPRMWSAVIQISSNIDKN